ncbi:hypothetical protein GW17_00042018 [Ensete ventricosum]|nr:hypothetical protein GW17_00042018 [Ensete ventricosum]
MCIDIAPFGDSRPPQSEKKRIRSPPPPHLVDLLWGDGDFGGVCRTRGFSTGETRTQPDGGFGLRLKVGLLMSRRTAFLHLNRLLGASRSPLPPPPRFVLRSPAPPPLLQRRSSSSSPLLLSFFSGNAAVSDAYENNLFPVHQGHGERRLGESQVEEEVAKYIPVKAFFLSTRFLRMICFGSIDLKSLQTENSSDVIPPTSRSSNYVALRYNDFQPETSVRSIV